MFGDFGDLQREMAAGIIKGGMMGRAAFDTHYLSSIVHEKALATRVLMMAKDNGVSDETIARFMDERWHPRLAFALAAMANAIMATQLEPARRWEALKDPTFEEPVAAFERPNGFIGVFTFDHGALSEETRPGGDDAPCWEVPYSQAAGFASEVRQRVIAELTNEATKLADPDQCDVACSIIHFAQAQLARMETTMILAICHEMAAGRRLAGGTEGLCRAAATGRLEYCTEDEDNQVDRLLAELFGSASEDGAGDE